MPCRSILLQLQERAETIEALGGRILAVSVAADYQARWLRDTQGITFPLLLDPDSSLKQALAFKPMALWRYLAPGTWWNWLKGWRRTRQGRITGKLQEVPGIVIFDAEGRLRYRYEGKTLGDYPPLQEVMDELTKVAG